jgi:raffinose/stachyose/melibiose transport system substrate-binding protein
MLRKIMLLAISIALLMSLFAGCSGETDEAQKSEETQKSTESEDKQEFDKEKKEDSAEPFTISVSSWQYSVSESNDPDGKIKAYKEATEKLFKSKYPNGEIEWNNIHGEKYFDVLKAKLASNSADDVIIHQDMLGVLGKGEYCADLSDEPWVEDMLDVCNPYVYFDGKVIAAPGDLNGWGAWYNKKIFRENGLEPPETYGDFLNICKTLKSNGITPFSFGFKDAWSAAGVWNMICPAFLYTEDEEFLVNVTRGSRKLTDSEVVDVFKRIQFLFSSGYANKNCLSIGWAQSRAEFLKENGAMMIQGAWLPSLVATEDEDFELGWMTIPDENGNAYVTAGVGACVSVNASSDYIKQGKDFIIAFRDKTTLGKYLIDKAAPPFKGWKLEHSIPAFKEWSNSFSEYPTAYGGDKFFAASAITDLQNIVIKMASGKEYNEEELKADLEKAQTDAMKDKDTVVLPE